ncbi:MAG: M4 family metallopeptidase [Pseudomonadota bacterium]
MNKAGAAPSLQRDSKGMLRQLSTRKGSAIPQPYNGLTTTNATEAARNFLADFGPAFGLKSSGNSVSALRTRSLADGRSVVRLQQHVSGIPVFGGQMIVHLDSAARVSLVRSDISTAATIDTTPLVTAESATAIANELVAKFYAKDPQSFYSLDPRSIETTSPELWVFDPARLRSDGGAQRLAWRIEATANRQHLPIRVLLFVDAHSGVVLWHIDLITHAKNRMTYDSNNTVVLQLPGSSPARVEGQPDIGIQDVDDAHNYAGDTYDFYMSTHGRDSLDDAGMALISTVRVCVAGESCPFANAFWTGTQMGYGEGFAAADDVVAHELTHGVTQFESNLIYAFESGAINESFSDIWGEFVDLTNSGGTDTPAVRWHMGEDVPVFGAIRNMQDPTIFNDPDRIGSPLYACLPASVDNGGVHINSGVGNKAAYLLTDGDTFNNVTVTGIGIDKTARIFYEAQTNLLTTSSGYSDLASALTTACTTLTGTNGITADDCTQVANAIAAVEMQDPVCVAPPVELCEANETPVNRFFDDLESGTLTNWSITNLIQSNNWRANGDNPAAGNFAIHGDNPSIISDSALAMNSAITIPANAYMFFEHSPNMEPTPVQGLGYDGGILEYSTDGSNWTDAGSLMINDGYDFVIVQTLNGGNPLAGDEPSLPTVAADICKPSLT